MEGEGKNEGYGRLGRFEGVGEGVGEGKIQITSTLF